MFFLSIAKSSWILHENVTKRGEIRPDEFARNPGKTKKLTETTNVASVVKKNI